MRHAMVHAMMVLAASMPTKWDPKIGCAGNSYPVNNRRGFAAKQKRQAKKARSKK